MRRSGWRDALHSLGPIDLGDPAMWDLGLQPNELRAAEQALAPLRGSNFTAISLGGKVDAKDWGDENWSVLARIDEQALAGTRTGFH